MSRVAFLVIRGPTAEDGGPRTPSLQFVHPGWLHFYKRRDSSLLLPGFPVTPPRNHNHPQLGGSTPADGAVKGLLWLGYIGPHGGLAGA